jgi:hypothetical protein
MRYGMECKNPNCAEHLIEDHLTKCPSCGTTDIATCRISETVADIGVLRADAQPEPPELTLAKKKYGDGLFLPSATDAVRDSVPYQRLLDRDEKFWPYKKWILYNGEWTPSLELPECQDRRTHAGRAFWKNK